MTVPPGISLAFDNDALDAAPSWTRIDHPDGTRGATSYTIDRGRDTELDRTGTGTATIQVVDTDGTYDPTNGGSPYSGKLDPGKQASIALWNPITEQWYPRFKGHVAEWLGDWDVGIINTVQLELVDAFDLAAVLEMTPGNVGDTAPFDSTQDIAFLEDPALDAVQTRIVQALTDAGWPSAWRTEVFTGNVGLQQVIYERRDQLLSAIMDAADAEFPGVANAFMDASGGLVFHGRFARFNPSDVSYNIRRWKVGSLDQCLGDSNRVPFTGLSWRRSNQDIINAVSALPQNVEPADVPGNLVTDPTSIGKYGWRSASYENLLTRNGSGPTTAVEETLKYAQYYVDNYAEPRTRVTQLRFKARGADTLNATALWALLCQVEISDIIDLSTTHRGGGGFAEDFFVEGIHYDVKPARVDANGEAELPELSLTLDVSPRAYFDVNPFE